MPRIELGNISVAINFKDIKNMHLSVYPPDGKVKISVPRKLSLDAVRVFVISKLQWIRKQQKIVLEQKREPEREYLSKESHYFKGKRYLLKLIERDDVPFVYLKHSEILLHVRPDSNFEKRKEVMEEWYRQELKDSAPVLIEKWEKKLGVKSNDLGIKKMRTKWGTCNIEAKRIWLNLELAKKPPECLEYIVLHELVHLIERTHNDNFQKIMSKHMPKWKSYKEELNRLPVGHVEWEY
jgi:predicted metal-dependent hydrolase